MINNEDNKIMITPQELQAKIDEAVTKSKVDALSIAFKDHERKEDQYLSELFSKISSMDNKVSSWAIKFNEVSHEMEKEILNKVAENYMTRKETIAGFKSIRIWIVSSVGGFTAAGATIFYLISLKIIGGG
jgi:preprotein translocase subunit SecA